MNELFNCEVCGRAYSGRDPSCHTRAERTAMTYIHIWPKHAAVNAESYFTDMEQKLNDRPELTEEDIRAMMAVIKALFGNKRHSLKSEGDQS